MIKRGIKEASRPIKNKNDVLRIQQRLKYSTEIEEVGERNYMIFTLGVATGFRAGDLVKLTISDIRKAVKKGEFLIMEGKKENHKNISKRKQKPRFAKLQPSVKKRLNEYLKDIDIKNSKCKKKRHRRLDSDYAFRSNKNKSEHISVDAISKEIKKVAEHYGLTNITSHSMRKTYAYNIYLITGKDLVVVQEMLCHESLKYTRDYIGLDREDYCQYSDEIDWVGK